MPAGPGIAWRSTWEVQGDIADGRLVALLQAFEAPPSGIYAVFAQRKHLPLRLRMWIDFLKHSFGDADDRGSRELRHGPSQRELSTPPPAVAA